MGKQIPRKYLLLRKIQLFEIECPILGCTGKTTFKSCIMLLIQTQERQQEKEKSVPRPTSMSSSITVEMVIRAARLQEEYQ